MDQGIANSTKLLKRRQFLQTAGVVSATVAASRTLLGASQSQTRGNPLVAFVKPFSKMPFDELADIISRLGFDGIEAPVRPGGLVEPDQVETELPRLCEAMEKKNLRVHIVTCGLNNLQQSNARRVLLAAAKCGIAFYRPGYYRYDLKKSIVEQIEVIKPQIAELAEFNRQNGLTMVYQNHSGATNFGAPLWDLHSVIRTYSADEIAVALDIGHATVEGGLSWPTECRLIQPHVRALFVKDFVWHARKVQWVPLGEGMVDRKALTFFQESGFSGPISLHVEYVDDEDPKHIEKYVLAFERDIRTLKSWLNG